MKSKEVYYSNEYEYYIELVYVDNRNNTTTNIDTQYIKSIMIDRDYDNNNMPIIYANVVLDRSLLDDMILYSQKNLIIIRFSKSIKNSTNKIKIKYAEFECAYFILDDLNKLPDLDDAAKENMMNNDLYRMTTIGLMKLDLINKNNIVQSNLVLRDTYMYDAVKYYTSKLDNILIEPFLYNNRHEQILIQSANTVSSIIRYLNNIDVFYNTSYRFFMDFDKTYLISSSGKPILSKNETIGDVIITVNKLMKNINIVDEGMVVDRNISAYKINVPNIDTQFYKDQLQDKKFRQITAITSDGIRQTTDLNINIADYNMPSDTVIRLHNNNIHKADNIASDINSKSVLFTMNKNNLDSSVLNINKRYLIKNYNPLYETDGEFLLSNKKEVYFRNDKSFTLNTLLMFRLLG